MTAVFPGGFRRLRGRLAGQFGAKLLKTSTAGSGAGILVSEQRERLDAFMVPPSAHALMGGMLAPFVNLEKGWLFVYEKKYGASVVCCFDVVRILPGLRIMSGMSFVAFTAKCH